MFDLIINMIAKNQEKKLGRFKVNKSTKLGPQFSLYKKLFAMSRA
jgi:hypothetical protein